MRGCCFEMVDPMTTAEQCDDGRGERGDRISKKSAGRGGKDIGRWGGNTLEYPVCRGRGYRGCGGAGGNPGAEDERRGAGGRMMRYPDRTPRKEAQAARRCRNAAGAERAGTAATRCADAPHAKAELWRTDSDITPPKEAQGARGCRNAAGAEWAGMAATRFESPRKRGWRGGAGTARKRKGRERRQRDLMGRRRADALQVGEDIIIWVGQVEEQIGRSFKDKQADAGQGGPALGGERGRQEAPEAGGSPAQSEGRRGDRMITNVNKVD
ncbi:hypothetical protein B0H14DRAFT_3164514 [Mycena olivaceomarginata]|nr:hypothetical protein B0H14DRAFT_3164514 [Mycena olivaceomarginata]